MADIIGWMERNKLLAAGIGIYVLYQLGKSKRRVSRQPAKNPGRYWHEQMFAIRDREHTKKPTAFNRGLKTGEQIALATHDVFGGKVGRASSYKMKPRKRR